MVLSGWKEISDYLRGGVRTVQRWENHGLPVHRPVPGKRSHVVAYSDELDWWRRDRQSRKAVPAHVLVTISNAERLCEQARATRAELRALMHTLREEMSNLRRQRRKLT